MRIDRNDPSTPSCLKASALRIACLLLLPWTQGNAAAAGPPTLFASGRPQLGKELRLEIGGGHGTAGFLLIDPVPGPTSIGAATFGVGFSAGLIVIPLGVLGDGVSTHILPIPALLELAGISVSVDVVTTSPLAAAGGLTLTLAQPLPLGSVNDYAYRLQGQNGADLKLAGLAASAFDLSITDFSRDGKSEFSPPEIAALKGGGDPNRVRLAYMSIGEAEDYRWYWKHISPDLIAANNPNWPGNFKVRYWDPEWKEVIVHGNPAIGASYLDRVIGQGFDGVFLDIFDAFEFFGPAEAGGTDWRRNAAREMVDLVVEMAYHARFERGRPDFVVIVQNGVNILDPEWYPADTLGVNDPATPTAMAAQVAARLLATVDGVGTEDILYGGNKDENNPLNPDTYLLGLLSAWQAAGALTLGTEYLTNTNKVGAFYDLHAKTYGLVPYATVRDLDKLTTNAGHEPD